MDHTHLAVRDLSEAVGPDGIINDVSACLSDPYSRLHGACVLALAPNTTEQVSEIARLCTRHKLAMVPQGGQTGLVGGTVPLSQYPSVVVSLRRLNRIREIDVTNRTVIAEAGVVLQRLKSSLNAEGVRFPMDLGSSASCQIGGIVSTNAGGISALRFGSTRDLTLGLEVVLADGQIWNGLRGVRKDNSGFDLKHLFLGAEGTLGIVTAATLKLVPVASTSQTALLAIGHIENTLPLFISAQESFGEFLTAFELISDVGLEHALETDDSLTRPLQRADHYILLELEAYSDRVELGALLETWLADQLGCGHAINAVISTTIGQRRSLWRIRELTPWARSPALQFDVSVPISKIPSLVCAANHAVHMICSDACINAFGHIGDGNVHYHVSIAAAAGEEMAALRGQLANTVHGLAMERGGSFSAEHGIGVLKKADLVRHKASVDLALFQRLKRTLDPLGLMNPGKMLDTESLAR